MFMHEIQETKTTLGGNGYVVPMPTIICKEIRELAHIIVRYYQYRQFQKQNVCVNVHAVRDYSSERQSLLQVDSPPATVDRPSRGFCQLPNELPASE
jgi:hypothetical protein